MCVCVFFIWSCKIDMQRHLFVHLMPRLDVYVQNHEWRERKKNICTSQRSAQGRGEERERGERRPSRPILTRKRIAKKSADKKKRKKGYQVYDKTCPLITWLYIKPIANTIAALDTKASDHLHSANTQDDGPEVLPAVGGDDEAAEAH